MPPQSAPSSFSSSIHLSFIFFFLSLGHISLTLAQNSSQAGQTTHVSLSYSRADYIFSPSILTLSCVPDDEEASFWRILDNATEQVVTSGPMVESVITFEVSPDREGVYYCRTNGVNSSTLLEIVAYPLLNDAIKSVKSYTAVLNSDTTIPCVFTPGVLRNRYSIQWFKGLTQIDTSDPRFRINSDDFSLVINSVNALDASSAYYCAVHVDVRFPDFDDYHRIGPSVELVITDSDSLTVTQSLENAVVSPGSQQQFSCTVFGLPPPSIMWLYQGSSITETPSGSQSYVKMSRLQVSTDANGTTVSSQLSFTDLLESHSGLVQCLVMQRAVEGGEDTIISSVATLTVLPNSFRPTALPTGTGMEVSLTLPTALPSSFSLVIYYYDTKELLVGKSELVDPAFADTRKVDYNYLVTGDKLPSILTFYLQIAVKVAGIEGSHSQSSNTITITERGQATNSPNSTPDPECDCSGASANTTTIQTILVIFIVFLIVLLTGALGVAIWGVVFMLRRARVKKTDSIGSFDDERSYDTKSHSPSRSRSSHRSRSRSWSQTSRSRSRSFTSSSRSPSPSGTEISNRSLSKVYSPSHDSVSTRGGREEPEGRYDDDEYVVINGAQPITRERSNTCTTLPLPSEPFREREEGTVKSSEANKENEYEELQFAKAKKRGKGRRGEREQQTVPKEQLQPAELNAEALSVV